MFRFRSDRPSAIITALVVGVVLSVAGSVLATTIGSSISVTSTLSVTGASTLTGNVGIATTTTGTLLNIQGAANFASGTSTIYTGLFLPSFSATSTAATSTLSTGGFAIGTTQFVVQQNSGWVGLGTSTPGSLFSIHGVGNFVGTAAATSTMYTDFTLRSVSATSSIYMANGTALVPSLTFASDVVTGIFRAAANQLAFTTNGAEVARFDASGNLGVGTTTPGSLLALGTMANFVSGATSTVANGLSAGRFLATSTTATTTISTGGFRVGQGADAAAFTVMQSATTSVGVGTSTPTSHQFAVHGNALIGAGANGTTTLTVNASGANGSGFFGGCIQLRAADGNMVRIYATTSTLIGTYTNNGGALPGRGLVVEAGGCN